MTEDAQSKGPSKGGVHRVFRLLLDVRSFKASRKFPFNRSKVVVVVSFPAEMEDAISTDQKSLRIGNLRSRPAVEVARGSEVLIPNSFLEVNFTTTALKFASTLADDPKCLVKVFRSDKYKSDLELGEALVPLQPLLTQPWIDGYAPVMEMEKGAQGTTGVQLGAIRVVVAVEEVGVAPSPPKRAREASADARQRADSQPSTSHAEEVRQTRAGSDTSHSSESSTSSTSSTSSSDDEDDTAEYSSGVDVIQDPDTAGFDRGVKGAPGEQPPAMPMGEAQQPAAAPPPPAAAETFQPMLRPKAAPAGGNDGMGMVQRDAIVHSEEYASAWEFEVWRAAEEARWRAEMKEKEIARMAFIQKEWKKRERERLLEIQKAEREVDALQKGLQKSLKAVEERERRLILAEEATTRRRKEMEREAATQALEAQTTIKRAKEDYECKVRIEKEKLSQAGELQSIAEGRLSRLQASFDRLERDFQDYREKVRATPESELQMRILNLQNSLRIAEEDKAKLSHSRAKLKEVNGKMERQLQWAYSIIQQEVMIKGNASKYSAQAAKLNEVAYTELESMRDEQAQLRRLKEEIRRMKQGGGDGADGEAPGGSQGGGVGSEGSALSAEDTQEMQRLQDEMQSLLSSGIYTAKDPVIASLKQKIDSIQAAA